MIPSKLWFYQEFLDSAKTEPSGNVVVVFPKTKHFQDSRLVYQALGRSYPHPFQEGDMPVDPDQPVTDWTVDESFLTLYCRRLDEKEARTIHPSLFTSCMDAHLKEIRDVRHRRQSLLLGTFVCVIVLFRAFFFPEWPISTT
jgi:hypothetical protein